jgi:hypothetical protein
MAASRHAIVTELSFVKVHARSTLHDIDGKGSGLTGYFEANFFGDRLSPEVRPKMHLDIPVAKLDSGNLLQDREMHGLISSKAFPNITCELNYAKPLDAPNEYNVAGSVSVRGTARLLTGHLNIRQRDGHVEIDGEKTIDIRQFDVKPPKFLNFQVYPEVTITMHLVARLQV